MIIEAATHFADGLCLTDPDFPIGAMAIPNADPHWVYDSPEGTWQPNHLVLCLTEGMRQSKIKPTIQHKLATINQSPSENPVVFLG